MSNTLDREEADELSSTPKIIRDDISWTPIGDGRYRLKVRVLAPVVNKVLSLEAYVGKTNRGYTLLFESLPIRRYCNQGTHTGPDRVTIKGPHKHIWDMATKDRSVYVPDDISLTGDPNQQLLEFLEEENITLLGEFQYMMFDRQ